VSNKFFKLLGTKYIYPVAVSMT